MKFSAALVGLASLATAAVLPVEHVDADLAERDTACTNGPLTRSCWNNGYSIATDFDQKHPNTGATVTYNFEITNGTCNPDGHGSRVCFLINGKYPGPPIVANWGDTVVVNFKNSLPNNGTAVHFHGVRQLNSCGADGVAGITQCPVAPYQSYTYTFQATQFGTSWYHSHFSSQYGDGIVGPIVFNGPASANYDIDLGTYTVNEWYYQTAFQVNAIASQNLQRGNSPSAAPPAADNMLINGTNKNAAGGGQYNYVTVSSGKKYRLRIINISLDNYIRVSLDNHPLQVMTSDFVPTKPFYTQWLLLAIGQRYDVVINANQTAGNYWFRAEVAADCASANNGHGRAVWSYSGVAVADPTSTAFASPAGGCVEPIPAPFWNQPVPTASFSDLNLGITGAQVVPGGGFIAVWALNSSSMNVAWEDPTISYIMSNNNSYPAALNVIPTTPEGSWNYWVIQQQANAPPIPHPIHLHGHDFFVIGQGSGTFNAATAKLNWATAPRRDTASVYGGGWLAIAYNSNNAGAWLLHCHIAWHISEGLGVQFLESPATAKLPDPTSYQNTCSSWNSYVKTAYYQKIDSGL